MSSMTLTKSKRSFDCVTKEKEVIFYEKKTMSFNIDFKGRVDGKFRALYFGSSDDLSKKNPVFEYPPSKEYPDQGV